MAEDQAKINEFARLTNRYTELKDIVKDLEVRLQSAHPHRPDIAALLLWLIAPLYSSPRLPQKERENIEDASNEVMLADDSDDAGIKIKVGRKLILSSFSNASFQPIPPPPPQIGDVYLAMEQDAAEAHIEKKKEKIEKRFGDLKGELDTTVARMKELRVSLYAKFGKSINLEFEED